MQSLIENLQKGNELSDEEISLAAEEILSEKNGETEKADFLSALANKGETPREIAGFAAAFLERAIDPGLDRNRVGGPLLDVCGTGGDKLNTFNVSTTTVFVLAASGVSVVKHGNRGITSKSGGADVLEALGIRIDLPPADFCRCVEEVGCGFLFAPLYHPAFKAVVPVRALLAQKGQRTIFNILGPLLNPVRPDFQVIGVFDEALGATFSKILERLDRTRAWAVHGKTESGAGMDEFSNAGLTKVWEFRDGEHFTFSIHPSDLGMEATTVAELEGGDAQENATILKGILDGSDKGPRRDVVLINAAAGLTVTGISSSMEEGIGLAGNAIDSGKALGILEKWKEFS